MVSFLLVSLQVPMSSGRSDISVVLLLHVWVSSNVAVGLDVGHSWGTVSVSMLIVAPHEVVLSGKSKSIRRLGSLSS